MNNQENIINFMYFANNFSQSLLYDMFETTSAPKHLKSKFMNRQVGNGTDKFFWWFMELDNNNKLAVCNFIDNHYKYASNYNISVSSGKPVTK